MPRSSYLDGFERVSKAAGLVHAAKVQSEFTFSDLEGTLVGLWSLGFSNAFRVGEYHFHFLSVDHHHGGPSC
jgi:acetolactate decarboxylase